MEIRRELGKRAGSMAAYLDLFTSETWQAFTAEQGEVTGFGASQRRTATKIGVGDRFLCYLVKLQRWIGDVDAAIALAGPQKGERVWTQLSSLERKRAMLGPNLGSINRAALVGCDHIVIPLAPDLYSIHKDALRNDCGAD